jgi:hypothetical protein
LGDAIASDIMKELESLVIQFAFEFGCHRKQLSGGSGSATDDNFDKDTLFTTALHLASVFTP